MIDLLIILMFLCPILLFFGMAVYLPGIGVISAILFAVDKASARQNKWRVPEKILMLSCLMGGAPFALMTMILCRHKTSKPQFFIPVVILVIVQVILLIVL